MSSLGFNVGPRRAISVLQTSAQPRKPRFKRHGIGLDDLLCDELLETYAGSSNRPDLNKLAMLRSHLPAP